ncbi:hypothetical protein [Actinomycetospora straminea]|uniref:PE family protein n=1 Tax=Actinomycetospora straminea TaxID=663607 RepID=A0ABP9EQC5_9PSEU|nr:hypothetical protein [Actinomycetospora straminea]MDD7933998.1 hypothetical protein [Actinomycetospora straminea]
MTRPLPVGGGAFTVDITRAPEAIRELRTALAELEEIKRDAVYLGQLQAPAGDQVSEDATRMLRETASLGPGSLLSALTDGIAEITRMIEALQVGFDAYRRADDDARAQQSS